ncbi:hypothetical protein PG996_009031 [Apiospora saccharicola]|uniref:Uncharacterized protein n=1 Tax=Apiospora saccharicola TaxID=335842 RepID=A0ABR1UJK9_9PEZI
MPFMTLPAEIRGLIYHAFLTNNATCQHVIPSSGGFFGQYDRFPCQGVPDHEFLQNLSRCCGGRGWGDYLDTIRFTEWRGGHLGCEPGTLFHHCEELPPPFRFYEAAAVYLRDAPLIICTADEFNAFVQRPGWDNRARAAPMQLMLDPIRRREGGFAIEREFLYRLVRVDLSSARLRILGPVDAAESRWLLERLSRGNRWSERCIGAIELVSPTPTKVATVRMESGSHVTIRPDVAWARVLHLLEERGEEYRKNLLNSYAMLSTVAEDLGLDIKSDSSRERPSQSSP